MKTPTNQVRQNRSAARPSPQVKTPPKKTVIRQPVAELLIPSKVAIAEGGMSTKRNSPVKLKPKATAKMEYAGDWLQSNIWFKIGLTKAEATMLKTIGRRIFNKPVSSAEVARALLLSALAHYDKLEPMMFQDVVYSQAEGFWKTDMYLHGVIAGQHAKLAERKRKRAS